MYPATNRFPWRRQYLDALKLLAQAVARLPFGVPDPVLCGGSAVELYTGSLWSAPHLEVIGSDARSLTAELFRTGFRWSLRPGKVERGLWHADLQIGIDIFEALEVPSRAEQANWLRVSRDLDCSEQREDLCLKTLGIEDLIVQQAGYWLTNGAPRGEAVMLVQALLGLARDGVCGPLRTGYLQRRLAQAADEDVVGMMNSGQGWGLLHVAPRALNLTEMEVRIEAWRDRHGLLPDARKAADPVRSRANRRMGVRQDHKSSGGRRSANILAFNAETLTPSR